MEKMREFYGKLFMNFGVDCVQGYENDGKKEKVCVQMEVCEMEK
jgi:hypothetical protein